MSWWKVVLYDNVRCCVTSCGTGESVSYPAWQEAAVLVPNTVSCEAYGSSSHEAANDVCVLKVHLLAQC